VSQLALIVDPAPGESPGVNSSLPAAPAGWITAARAGQIMGLSGHAVAVRCKAGGLPALLCRDGNRPAWYIDPSRVPVLLVVAGNLAAPAPAASELAAMTDSQRRRAMGRMAIVEQYLQARGQLAAGTNVNEFHNNWCAAYCALHGEQFSPRSLWNWVAAYRAGGFTGLADHRGRPPARQWSPEAMRFIVAQYSDESRPNVAVCWERANALAGGHGWAMPSLRTAQTWIAKRVDPKLIVAGRDPKRYRDRCIPDIHRDWAQVPAMRLWVGDHRRLDVMVPHPVQVKDAKAVGGWRTVYQWHRPWLTLWIDARTWKPTGWLIRFEDPDSQAVMSAFCTGVEKYGRPEEALIDNGRDFKGPRFAGSRKTRRHGDAETRGNDEEIMDPGSTGNLLQALGVRPHFALPYNSKTKPIEPWFRLMSERFDRVFPSYIGNREDRKPERFDMAHHAKSERMHALRNKAEEFYRSGLTIESVAAAFGQWVEEDFCRRECPISASKGFTVDQAFEQLQDPGFQVVRPAAQDLALLLMPSKPVVVTKDGVWCRAFSAYYWADELEPIRCCSGRDKARHVVYRWRAGDPSRIYVFSGRNGAFLAVARPAPGQAVHPLAAPGSQDAEGLAEGMRHKRHVAKRPRAELKAMRTQAHELLLGAQRQGVRGILPRSEDLGTRQDAASTPGAATVISLVGAISQAAEAGRKEQKGHEAAERHQSAHDWLLSKSATGTDDLLAQNSANVLPGGTGGASALEILAASMGQGNAEESTDDRDGNGQAG
jgi:hypothetical protein